MNAAVFAQSTTQPLSLKNIYRQGVTQYEQGYYLEAIAAFEDILSNSAEISPKDQALVEEKLARSYHLAGYGDRAIEYWNKALNYYKSTNQSEKTTKILVEKAQSYLIIGQPYQSIELLCLPQGQQKLSEQDPRKRVTQYKKNCYSNSPVTIADSSNNSQLVIAVNAALAKAFRLIGGRNNYNMAIYLLKELKKNYVQADSNELVSIDLDLGQLYTNQALIEHRRVAYAKDYNKIRQRDFEAKAKQKEVEAQFLFQKILNSETTQFKVQRVEAQSSLINSYYRLKDFNLIDEKLNLLYEDVQELPSSRKKAFTLIEIASLYFESQTDEFPSPFLTENVDALLELALSIGKELEDFRIQSFAYGELGHLYEDRAANLSENFELKAKKQEYVETALEFTKKARLFASEQEDNKDSLYLWEWQTARLYHELYRPEAEQQAYKSAINTLKEIRLDLISGNTETRFDFKESIEPIYRNFVEILLSAAQNFEEQSPLQQQTIDTANQTLNELRLAELQNFFGNDCNLILFNQEQADKLVDDHTAIIRSIILEKHPYLIVSFANEKRYLYSLNISSEDLKQQIRDFREVLSDGSNRLNSDFQPQAIRLHKSLFSDKLTQQLQTKNISTLVFVNDGLLQHIPMAALFDGKKYLIETYAIATTPSLQVTAPKSLKKINTKSAALVVTLNNDVADSDGQIFLKLPLASRERDDILSLFEKSTAIPNQDQQFTIQNIASELNKRDYSVVHIATHGKFDFDPELSFLVTEDPSEVKLELSKFEKIMQQVNTDRTRIDILALTGCETAVGDPRSSLGLAGIAVQSGVNSAIASLWQIEETSSTPLLMQKFYQNYLDGKSKAKALQIAQIELIHGKDKASRRPYYWSPFILIGNWL